MDIRNNYFFFCEGIEALEHAQNDLSVEMFKNSMDEALSNLG